MLGVVHPVGHMLVNGTFLIFIDPGWREVSIMSLLWEEWGVMAAMLEIPAGCIVCQRPILSPLLLRCLHSHPTTFPPMSDPCSLSLAISLFTYFFLCLSL